MIRTELLPQDGFSIEDLKRRSLSNHNHYRTYPTHRSLPDYERDLPKHNGQTFLDYIEERLAQNQ